MDFNPSIPGYVFEYVPTPLASHIGNFILKKFPFDKTTSSNEKTEVSFPEKQAPKITGIFDENHRLIPLEKCQFFDHSEMIFLSSKKTHFEKTTSSEEKPRSLLQKKEARKKFGIFNQNHWLTPLEKCKFFDYSKVTFMWSKIDKSGCPLALETFLKILRSCLSKKS